MSDWQKTTVGEVATGFLSGGTPTTSRADYWKGEIPWITSKWLGDKLELTNGEKFVSEEAVKKTSTKIVPKDSIIFATRVGVGKVGINRIDLAINQDLAGVLIDNENYDIKFLAYQLGIDSIQQYVAMNKRGATIKGITRDCLEQIRLNVPPLPEQKKIAHILSTVQRAIEAQERIIQTTTELKKALMHKLFTEGLRKEPQKQTEIGPVPESWEVVELNQLADLKNGYAFKSTDYVAESNTLNIRMSNIRPGAQFDLEYNPRFLPDHFAETQKSFLLEDGDLIIAMTDMANDPKILGVPTIVRNPSGKKLLLNQRVGKLVPTESRRVNLEFLRFYLSRKPAQRYLVSCAKKGVQVNIGKKDILSVPIAFPKPDEQKTIVKCFNTLGDKVAAAENKVVALQDLFRTLLHELMTAKTRVHELTLPQEGTRHD
ncbi:restriction endonuclease subunit S [Haloferula sp.]|uniref:restriction endonuclease subunit S n=1 Tax=Haloferula sp. TaxID=2497595 RepID=UPI003C744668